MSRRALRARLRRWLRPPRSLRPTRAGWTYTAICFGVGFAALNTGNNLLYLLFALLLGFLVFSGIFSEAALRGIDVRRVLPDEMWAGQPARIALEIVNRQRRFPAFAVVVEDLLGEDVHRGACAGRVFVLRVAAGARVRRSYPFEPERRGTVSWCGFRASTRFPFGLFSKSLRLERATRALAFPAIEPFRVSPDSGLPGYGDSRPGAGTASAEVSGLREYAAGDGFRRIHWPRSLRSGALWVRRQDNTAGGAREVHLRTRGVAPGAPFEDSVRRAASDVVAHLDAGFAVGLRTDDEVIPADRGAAHRRELLALLAVVNATSDDGRAAA